MQRSSNKTTPAAQSEDGAAVEVDTASIDAAHIDAAHIDAWARHAAAANGFGDAAVERAARSDQRQDGSGDARPGRDPGRPDGARRR